MLELTFSGEVFYWRGPAPYYFVRVPAPECRDISDVTDRVSYGWGMVPVIATVGASSWYTALWPKDGGYVLPVKTWVRTAEGVDDGVAVDVHLVVDRREELVSHPAAR